MRGFEKKEMLEMIDFLDNANSMIVKNQGMLLSSELTGLLTDCQQKAIEVGERIEASEGTGTRAVSLLEEYCEQLYQISISLEDRLQVMSLLNNIHQLIEKVSLSIRRDIPDSKLEVVFLPYMASMWDSLESIWLAARDDPDCETYVIPIPYYDKQPDGALGQLHYEGTQFPDYVPVTSWTAYSVADRHPDVIYIHNPYDGHNNVTNIHPDYYARELRKYTDMLVYVPYFVTMETVPEHLCILPGTMYANKVIVQSEPIQQDYIEAFHRFEEEGNCKGFFGRLEDKFLPLGSPKFDKVISAMKEDYEIPDDWDKKLRTPDNKEKKVILYNTSIEAFLSNKGKYLEKIAAVLEAFKGSKEFVLLWRPHPLIGATIASRSSELYEGYLSIVQKFKDEGWGIYDDSPELNRAIAVSDAYYGDGSSVAALYQKTGKPILIQELSE